MKNQSLRSKKITALNDFIADGVEQLIYQSQFNYHDVGMKVFTRELKLLKDFSMNLPREWFEARGSSVNIYVSSPERYDFSFEEFSDEACQDCFIETEQIIQRDFIAREVDGDIYLICEPRLSDGFYNFLRWFLPKRMLEHHKLIMHSSCILDRSGNAHLFLGHSGAGKTTITSFAEGREILGDDMNVIFNRDNQFFACPGGIGGFFKPTVSYANSYPIKSFNWLEQTERHERKELSTAEGSTKLMASVANIFWQNLDQDSVAKIFNLCADASQKHHSYILGTRKDPGFWSLIEQEKYVLNKNIQISDMGDECFILDGEAEKIHELNQVGKWVLEKLNKPMSTEQLIENLIEEYDVAKAEATEDLQCLVAQLLENKIINLSL